MNEFVIQGIGFIGVVFSILSYQIKSNKALFAMQILSCTAFIIQFALLGGLDASYNLMITLARNTVIMFQDKHDWAKSKIWLVVFSAMSITVLITSWTGWISLLPFIPVFMCTFYYFTNNAQKIRLGNLLFGSPPWIIYDIIIGSYAGVINELICVGSVLVSIYRYGWKAMGSEDSGF